MIPGMIFMFETISIYTNICAPHKWTVKKIISGARHEKQQIMVWYGLTVSEKREIHQLLIYLSGFWLCTRSIFFISKWLPFQSASPPIHVQHIWFSWTPSYHMGKVKTPYVHVWNYLWDGRMKQVTVGHSKKMLFMQRTPLFLPFQPFRLHCFGG